MVMTITAIVIATEYTKNIDNNPNITLDYTFVYEGNTYNLKLNKKNIKFDETIEWYGPLYLLKYAGKNK